jgi:predicted nucleic acid-binding protein
MGNLLPCGLEMSKRVLLDTNLVVVYLVGALGMGEIEKFKRTRQFTSQDVIILDDLLNGKEVYTTPHIVAETSNLLDCMSDKNKQEQLKMLLARYVELSHEITIPAKEVILTPIYKTLGITDAVLFQLAKEKKLTLITVDFALYNYASKYKVDVINFNHKRVIGI